MDSLVALGEVIYLKGEIDSARIRWNRAMNLVRETGDSARMAKVMTWLGLAAWRQGDYDTAEDIGRKALNLKLRLGVDADLFKSFNALGLLAWNRGDLSEAIQLFTKAIDAASSHQDRRGVAAASGNLALVWTELGQFETARTGFETMLSAGRDLPDARIEGNALTNLGMLAIRVGDPTAAIPHLRAARSVYASIDYPTGEQNALGQLGTALAALGNPGQAIATLDTALALSRRQGLKQEEASNLEALAVIVGDAGDARRALALYSRAREINAELGLEVELGNNQRDAARILSNLGAGKAAEALADSALHSHTRTGAQLEELRDHILLAELAGIRGDKTVAAQEVTAAGRVAKRIGAPQAYREVALAEAGLADRSGDATRALRALGRRGNDWAAAPFPLQGEAAALAARSHARLGNLDAAIEQGRHAVYALERVRGAYRSGHLQTAYLADQTEVYGDLARALLRQGKVPDAFEVADAARARALLEHMALGGGSISDNAPVAKLTLAETMLRRFSGLKEQLAMAEAEAQASDSAAQATLRTLRSALDSMRREYESAAEEALKVRELTAVLGTATPNSEAIQRVLRPGELVLEYLATQNELLIFGVSATELHYARVPVRLGALASPARLARELLSKPGGDAALAHPVLSGLYRNLIGPAARGGWFEGIHTLLFATHGLLSYIPYAALREPESGRYLAETKTLIHIPSGAALMALRERLPSSPGGLRDGASGAAFAPFPDELRASRGEAEAVVEEGDGVRLLLGRRATETALRRALAQAGTVHIASHGYMNPGNPMASRIAVTPEGKAGEEDGWLEVQEILRLSVASPLVFLSGCETGLGEAWSTSFTPGDDFMTLAQAFLHSGAANVVATLWRVRDRAAAEFAGAYYGALRGRDPASALAEAQRAMLREPELAHPYHWAAYRIVGSGPETRDGRKSGSAVRLSYRKHAQYAP